MATSKIEWTEATWNPSTGCSKVSPGCANCYAERMAYRLQAMGQPNYRNGFEVALHEQMLDIPLRWKKSRSIFVNSMSDLLHEEIPFKFIEKVFRVMEQAHWHRFQVLTKRSQRLLELDKFIRWPENVWMGVSVESNRFVRRIDDLKGTGAHIKFLSIEPLLGPVPDLRLEGIDWVIVGGESGPGARPLDPAWVIDIRDRCMRARVPFFFKQWGGTNKKKAGRSLDGKIYSQMPERTAQFR